ncbi:hypothetical protein CR513_07753, partial [Mucuna pruriens]
MIVHKSLEDPENCSQLKDLGDIYELLTYKKGTEAIRSIKADYSVDKNQKLKLSPHVYTKMSKYNFCIFLANIIIIDICLDTLPSVIGEFFAKKLVILDLSYSQAEKLFHMSYSMVFVASDHVCMIYDQLEMFSLPTL